MTERIFNTRTGSSNPFYCVKKASESFVINKLSGMTFAITGSHSVVRDDLVTFIQLLGGVVHSGVGPLTHTLLIPNDHVLETTKLTKAKKFGTTIMTEDEFCKMVLGMQ